MKSKQTVVTVICILFFSIVLGLILNSFFVDFNTVYNNKLQTPLFTGFLTLGSFLLTLKTFIIVQLKDKLYDQDVYIEKFARDRFKDEKIKIYDPITHLAELLLVAVIMALGTSFLQITVGFIGSQFTSAICFSFAIGTLTLVFIAWWQIRKNIYDLFEISEKMREKDVQKKQEQILKEAKENAVAD
ncbi:MAG: hypothetical protein LUM44_12590 [Pyrinomonadaceae bacterium]|nr:hypothetical protein [Pyrinomonadaceae bacterium]